MTPRTRLLVVACMTACGDSGGSTASSTSVTGVSAATTGTTMAPGTGDASTASTASTGGGATMVQDTGAPTDALTASTASTGGGATLDQDTGAPTGVSTGTTELIKYDVGGPGWTDTSTGEPAPVCKVSGEDAPAPCVDKAPPNSFAAEVQWAWEGPVPENRCGVTPLVGNFTDDNADGEIDLCDKPDILVVVGFKVGSGYLYLFDGETGAVHWKIDVVVSWATTPAIGDIDGDGLLEIVTSDPAGKLLAYEHDGAPKWSVDAAVPYATAMGLADLDADGDVEIYGSRLVLDHEGNLLHTLADEKFSYPATAAADLDGDGDLEVVLGATAFHHDGTPYYDASQIGPGYPQIADLDADGLPEVLVTSSDGFSILEHDGAVKPGYMNLRPTNDPVGFLNWRRPATIHDFDGDGLPEFAQSSAIHYTVFEPDPVSIRWSAEVLDSSGIAAGTAFDFLGDGIAEAMYADESKFYAFDGTGQPLMTAPRYSGTMIEYPTVADVDNDGAAEVVIVSYTLNQVPSGYPCVQVLRDAEERWVGARRIWNQHTYHVTNVREDGTIPQHEPRHWQQLNTFRTNAQVEGGTTCKPTPPG